MTTVRLSQDAIDVSGHSGYAEGGADIVCAAVTSAVRLVECILNDGMGLGAAVSAQPEDARIRIELSGIRAQERGGGVITGFARYMEQLAREYPGYVRVVYERNE